VLSRPASGAVGGTWPTVPPSRPHGCLRRRSLAEQEYCRSRDFPLTDSPFLRCRYIQLYCISRTDIILIIIIIVFNKRSKIVIFRLTKYYILCFSIIYYITPLVYIIIPITPSEKNVFALTFQPVSDQAIFRLVYHVIPPRCVIYCRID